MTWLHLSPDPLADCVLLSENCSTAGKIREESSEAADGGFAIRQDSLGAAGKENPGTYQDILETWRGS